MKYRQAKIAEKTEQANSAALLIHGTWVPAVLRNKDGNLMPFPCTVVAGETYLVEADLELSLRAIEAENAMQQLHDMVTLPSGDACTSCGKPFTILQAAFAFEGLCADCYDEKYAPRCICGMRTDYKYNGKPMCLSCMAKEVHH